VSSGVSIRELLDGAIRFVRVAFPRVFLPIGVPMSLVQGVSVVLQSRIQTTESPSGLDLALLFAAVGATLVVYGFGYYALQVVATDGVAGRALVVRRAWLVPLRPRVFATLLLSGAAVMAGTLLCLLPGIYLGLVLSLLMPVIVEERLFGLAALRRCAAVARFNPSRRFGEDPRVKVLLLGIAGWLIGYLLGFLVQLPMMGAMIFIVARRSIGEGSGESLEEAMSDLIWVQAPTAVAGALIQTAVSLYMAYGVAMLYFDTRRRMSGEDLEAELEILAGPALLGSGA
jgi:hypothetical protein